MQLRNLQQQGIGQGHGGDRVRALQKHHGFAKRLIRGNDLYYFFVAER